MYRVTEFKLWIQNIAQFESEFNLPLPLFFKTCEITLKLNIVTVWFVLTRHFHSYPITIIYIMNKLRAGQYGPKIIFR